MKLLIKPGTMIPLLLLLSMAVGVSAPEPEPLFEVRFTREGVLFAGTIDSEENALTVAEAVKAVRPDLKILNRGLRIDENAEVLPLSDLKSLLAELGIATHEGRFSLYEDSIILGGMTDSRIAVTALRIRLEPILRDRTLINRLCLVGKDDMPRLNVLLANGETSGPLLNFDIVPSAAESFEPPGLSLANLFPMMLTLSDLSRLTESPDLTASEGGTATLQAVPLLKVRGIGGRRAASPTAVLRAVPAGPQPTYVPLPSVFYTRSSFLLQANQEAALESIVKQLSTPPLAGHTIYLRPVQSSSQTGAFGDYLTDKRGEAAKELLVGRGIPEALITVEVVEANTNADTGEVKLLVKIPPAPAEEENVPPDETPDLVETDLDAPATTDPASPPE